MLKLLALTLWALAFIADLFVLACDVWHGAPYGVPYFVGAAILGVIEPLGTWASVKRHPETDWFGWMVLGLTTIGVTLLTLPQLFVLLWA